MPDFDPINLLITLDSGVTEVDVFEDIYTAWKDWMLGHPNNRRAPQAFRSDGGNPLSSIINQGGYIFLNNTAGWRLKPPEEDITVYLTGNLAVEDTTLPAFVPTTGDFTAAIIGLQPVTQGVTQAMASQLAFNTFQGVVCIDPTNGVAGTGDVGFDPIGTRRAPSNNITDALAILQREGLHTFQVLNDLTLSGIDLSAGYQFIGDSPYIVFNAQPSADVSNCALMNLTVQGELDGLNLLERCSVGAVTSLSGFVEKCAFQSTVSLSGTTHCFDCYSQVAGSGYPVFTTGSFDFVTRDWRGSYGISGMTGGDHSNGLAGGRILFDNTCTGGTARVRGMPFDIINNANGTTVLDETESQQTREVHAANFNRRKYDKVAKTVTLYAADGLTPLAVWDDPSGDLSELVPQ